MSPPLPLLFQRPARTCCPNGTANPAACLPGRQRTSQHCRDALCRYFDGSQDSSVYPGHLSWGVPKGTLHGTHAQETLGRERAESGGCGLPGLMRTAPEHGGSPLPGSTSQCFRITRQGAAIPAATGQVPPRCEHCPSTAYNTLLPAPRPGVALPHLYGLAFALSSRRGLPESLGFAVGAQEGGRGLQASPLSGRMCIKSVNSNCRKWGLRAGGGGSTF